MATRLFRNLFQGDASRKVTAMRSLSCALLLLLASTPLGAQEFIRGDCNVDGFVNIADAIYLVNALFIPGPFILPCYRACDTDDNSVANLNDVVQIFNVLYVPGSTPIAPPYPDCGPDPTPDFYPCNYDCSPPAPPVPDPAYVLSLTDEMGPIGGSTQVSVMLDSSAGQDLQAWSVSVCHDADDVEVLAVELGATALTVHGGGPPAIYEAAIYPGEGWTAGAIVDFFANDLLPAGPDRELQIATYGLLTKGVTTLDYCEVFGDPLVTNLLFSYTGAITPTVTSGTIAVVDEAFLRGDANGDGTFSALTDAITLFAFGFVPGSPSPPCLDAADADDNGILNSLVDGLFVLSYQYVPGSPPPPAPGPSQCGQDPTSDPFGCEFPVACP